MQCVCSACHVSDAGSPLLKAVYVICVPCFRCWLTVIECSVCVLRAMFQMLVDCY